MLLVYLFGIPLLLFFVLSLLTRKYRNPWRLYMLFGKKGSGKSSTLVKIAIKYLKKGFVVYTNMSDMMLDGVRLIDVNDLGDFVPEANSLLLCDEAGTLWDNRAFKSFKSSTRDFFVYQRHYKVIVYLASQSFDIDKKIRDRVDGMYLHVCLFNVLSVGKRIYKSITLTEPTSEAESRIAERLKFAPIWNWSFTWIPRYSKYYDSYNLPLHEHIPYTDLSGFKILAKSKKSARKTG